MSKDLEARLLASVPTIGHFQRFEELGISEETFKFYGPMYHYMRDIIDEHQHLPRLIDLRATFNVPDHVQRKPEEFDWLLEEFLNLSIIERIQSTMDSDVEKFGDSPQDLLPALIKDLTSLSLPNQRFASVSDTSALERMSRYEANAPSSEEMIVGIPTGIRYFDAEYRVGWMPGELEGIIGRIYVGKSWMLMYHGIRAWQSGRRILFISPEMPEEEAEARLDTLMCGMAGVRIDYNDIIRGYKPTPQQQAVFEQMAKRGDWVTLCSAEGKPFRLGEITRYVKQFSPDVLLIDGLLLVGSETRGQPWERINEISYGLKNFAIGANIVIAVAHQANREAHNTGKPPGLHEIYMGDSFGQAADRVLVLSNPSKKKEILRVTIQKFRKGRPYQKGIDFEFKPEFGVVREMEKRERLSKPDDLMEEEEAGLLPVP